MLCRLSLLRAEGGLSRAPSQASLCLPQPATNGYPLGEIRVAQMIAVVMTPDRFRTRQQFWSYCGLGIVTRSSSDWVQTSDGRWARAHQGSCSMIGSHAAVA